MNPIPSHRANCWPWVLSGLLVIVLVIVWFRCYAWPVQVTTIYLVRHAEKADSSADPPLSAAGQARAAELAHVLADEGINTVFTTQFIRTQQTGAPVAGMENINPTPYQATDTQGVADTIINHHGGKRILVVGHSNTVDDIAAALGATGLSDLSENQFDRLFVIHRFADMAHLDRLRYGVETP